MCAWFLQRPGRASPTGAPSSLDPRLVGDPVHLPGLPTIVGEGLLEVRRRPCDVGPDVAHQDRSALPDLLVVELAPPVAELAHGRGPERRVLPRRPVQGPLLRGR